MSKQTIYTDKKQDDDEKRLVKCKHCKYLWMSKTKMYMIGCPRCGNKVRLGRLVKK